MTFEEQIMRYSAPYSGIDAMAEVDNLVELGVGAAHISFGTRLGSLEWGGTGNSPHAFMVQDFGPWFDERVRRFTDKCRENGILSVVYTCLHTVAVHNVVKHPESWDWLVNDEKGRPLLQAFYVKWRAKRFQGCVNNPGWMEHLKRVTEKAHELGFGGIFYDNPNWVWCYCPYCQEKFAEYLKSKGAKPVPIPHEPDWEDEIWQHYHMFLCETVRDRIAELSAHIKSIDPEFRITVNSQPPSRHSPATRSLTSYITNQAVDWIFYEHSPAAGQNDDGSIQWNVDQWSYGIAEAEKLDKLLTAVFYRKDRADGRLFPNISRLSLAAGWAFRSAPIVSDVMFAHNFHPSLVLKPYFEFMRQHARLYLDSRMSAQVGVYFAFPNLYWHLAPQHAQVDPNIEWNTHSEIVGNPNPNFSAICHLLAHSHIPFKTILDLADADVDVLILPEVAYLTDEEVEAIGKLVQGGMGLLATGQTSLFYRNKIQEEYALARVFGTTKTAAQSLKNHFGKGKVMLLPHAPERKYAERQDANLAHEIISALRWLSGKERFSIEADAPKEVLITTMQSPDRTLVSLVNYKAKLSDDSLTPAGPVTIHLDRAPKSVELLSPDGEVPEIEVNAEGDGCRITVPETHIYNLLVLENGRRA